MSLIEYLREFRIGEYAIFDFVASFLGVYLLSQFLSKILLKIKIYIPKQNWLFLVLPIGVFIHILVGNITPMTKDFLDINGNFILKILILGLLILGMKDVKIVKKRKV